MKDSNEKGKSEFYETFDSGSGPINPDKGQSAHKDSGSGLNSYTSNAADKKQGSVPEIPSKKR